MSVIAQAVEGALVTGCVYGLVGAGFAILFRASKVLSFAQGGFMLLGAFVFYSLVRNGRPFLVALIVTVAVVAAASALLYLVVFARIAAREPFSTSVATIGLSGVLLAAVAVTYGTAPLTLPDVVSPRAYHVLSAVVPTADLVAVAMTGAAAAVLLLILRRTPLGTRMRAVADNVSLASHLGISATRVATAAWALAGVTAALAGIAFSLRSSVDPAGVANIGLFAFPAIILGGLDSVGGAFLGGLLLGGIQQSVQLVASSSWVDLVSFAVMLGFLYFRPSGLFGRAEAVRL